MCIYTHSCDGDLHLLDNGCDNMIQFLLLTITLNYSPQSVFAGESIPTNTTLS